MVVDPINGGQEVQRAQNVKRNDTKQRDTAAAKAKSADTVEISSKAREAAQTHSAIEMVKSVPDVDRRDKVESARERIMGGNYLTPKVVDEIAEKIANLLIR